ncbi:DUF5677 domain-containing protein [Azospirillum sp. A26]|uniref:DUF5677 domain-containing protein n=1 Tax=Azospirillum sp. A26 TaxID=3160607 RepID=UPI003671D994
MNNDSSIHALQEVNLQCLTHIRDEIQSLFSRYGSDSFPETQTLKCLFWYLSSRNQAVSFLISHGYLWDSEIILRSFYEVAAKILFISFSEDNEKAVLIDEFWNGLGSINDRKRARKAAYAEQIFEAGSMSAEVFSALQDDRTFDLQAEGSKTQRKRIEQKWSFSEIIEQLDQKVSHGKPLEGIKSMLHMYGIASHLIHADQAAMDLMHDRATREHGEREILEAAHVARIMSDQVNITWFCADALRQNFKGEFIDNVKLRELLKEFAKLSDPFHANFSESQRDFYALRQAKANQDPIK